MAMVADAFVSLFIAELGVLAKEEAVMLLGVKEDLKKLEKKLQTIRYVLKDAERRRIDIKGEEAVKFWLSELRDIMFDADDIIDECRAEGEKLSSSPPTPTGGSVSCSPSLFSCFTKLKFRHKLGKEIQSINDRIEENSKEKSQLHLIPMSEDQSRHTNQDRKTSSVFVESDVVGIEDDMNTLVRELTERKNRKVVSFAVWGEGGIGKTTIAQKIFSHHLIKSQFEMKIWVWVSQNFKEIDVLKQIIRCAGGSCGERETKEELDALLIEVVRDKRFLLVLDDVWDGKVWEKLRAPLQSAKNNSWVFVTTRNQNVAIEIGAVYSHRMKLLSVENGWDMLCKRVFEEENKEDAAAAAGELRDVGIRIVEKCKGLPLAIEALGGILKTKDKKKREWEKVLKSHTWSLTGLPSDVMPALCLSYEDLPSYLKQCFVYCSLYPEDFSIDVDDLIRKWIAEGFVERKGDLTMEELAEDYYRELVRRSFLQGGKDRNCNMHDLFRTLGHFLAQQEHFSGDFQGLDTLDFAHVKLRRLSVVGHQVPAFPNVIKEQKWLRTLSLYKMSTIRNVSDDLFIQLKRLRVLDLSGMIGYSVMWVERLPGSVGNLIHLRYLNLSHSDLKELPESLQYLQNLQTLDLSNCWNLCQIPNGIVNLKNLRHLIIEDTKIDQMPTGIGRLTNLQTLTGFVAANNCETSNMEELNSLSQLTSLSITRLERLSSRAEAKKAELRNKPKLMNLKLYVTLKEASEQEPGEAMIKTIEEVFEELYPPLCLESLTIHGFFGRKFPNWISGESLVNLTKLALWYATLCEQLPMLGQLPQLRSLDIYHTARVRTVGSEFYGGARAFCKLEMLTFSSMYDWEEWEAWEGDQVLSCLKRLDISYCPKLKYLPETLPQPTVVEEPELYFFEEIYMPTWTFYFEK